MASKIGEAVIKLTFDGSGVKSELAQTERSVSNFGTKVKKVASNIGKVLAAGFAAATTAAVAFSKQAIDAFNTQEEALAKLEQVAENQNWSANAVNNLKAYNAELQKAGIIGDEVMAAGQAQLGTFALSEEAVRTLTPAMNDLIAATAGFEATTDSATSMANLMGKVMTGSVSALTRYGVTLDENQKKLLEQGDEMTRAAVLAEVLANNYGNFNEKLAETPQGQVKQLSNAFSDLKESFGAFLAGRGDLDEFFENLTIVVDNAINLIITMAPQIIEGLVKLIEQIGAQLPNILQQLVPVLTQAILNLTIAFAKALPGIIKALVNILPILIQTIVAFLTSPETIQQLVQAAIELFFALVLAVPQILGALIEAFGTLVGNLWNGITQMFGEFAANFGNFIGDIFKGAINAVIAFIEGFVNIPIDLLNGFIWIINSAFGWIGVNIEAIPRIQLPRLAQGGVADGATTAIIGEDGQEAVLPLEHNTDNWSGLLATALAEKMEEQETPTGGTINVYMTNEINNKLDAEEIGRTMIQSIRRYA